MAAIRLSFAIKLGRCHWSRRFMRIALLIVAVLGAVSARPAAACEGCGCNGGPGYRGPHGHCVGWASLSRLCGDPPATSCSYEGGVAAAPTALLVAPPGTPLKSDLSARPQEAPPTAEKQTLAINPVVTQATLQSTVCIRGWTATVRPSFFASQRIKLEKMKALGATETTAYELDHIIPLCAGGSPDDPSNLQLQPWAEATRKDRLEAQACRCLCKGKISLAEVQADCQRPQASTSFGLRKPSRSSAVASASLSLAMSAQLSRQATTPHHWIPHGESTHDHHGRSNERAGR